LSYASDDLRSLCLELCGVALVRLLLAVFQAAALVILEQAVAAAEMALAEAAVPDDALGGLLALLGGAADLLGRHDVGRVGAGHAGSRRRAGRGCESRLREVKVEAEAAAFGSVALVGGAVTAVLRRRW